ncbi:hypothetical protein Smp_163350 [Schistosoma mansoni]|uniref:hypothetical protein n=1 Tax=Schistosoma mansoni TaxID=6183 RepID=UPI00022C87CB|nr:hypothetical protein Smp_163350 [Schistosoma mansoni]|eukprot:XP_018646642.1 hypothetical protein Smp_163350 [Schistosoma mansoni]
MSGPFKKSFIEFFKAEQRLDAFCVEGAKISLFRHEYVTYPFNEYRIDLNTVAHLKGRINKTKA